MTDWVDAGYREKKAQLDAELGNSTPIIDYYEGKYGPNGYVLPHSCDGWHLGDIDDLRAMVTDLNEVIAEAELDTPSVLQGESFEGDETLSSVSSPSTPLTGNDEDNEEE